MKTTMHTSGNGEWKITCESGCRRKGKSHFHCLKTICSRNWICLPHRFMKYFHIQVFGFNSITRQTPKDSTISGNQAITKVQQTLLFSTHYFEYFYENQSFQMISRYGFKLRWSCIFILQSSNEFSNK